MGEFRAMDSERAPLNSGSAGAEFRVTASDCSRDRRSRRSRATLCADGRFARSIALSEGIGTIHQSTEEPNLRCPSTGPLSTQPIRPIRPTNRTSESPSPAARPAGQFHPASFDFVSGSHSFRIGATPILVGVHLRRFQFRLGVSHRSDQFKRTGPKRARAQRPVGDGVDMVSTGDGGRPRRVATGPTPKRSLRTSQHRKHLSRRTGCADHSNPSGRRALPPEIHPDAMVMVPSLRRFEVVCSALRGVGSWTVVALRCKTTGDAFRRLLSRSFPSAGDHIFESRTRTTFIARSIRSRRSSRCARV